MISHIIIHYNKRKSPQKLFPLMLLCPYYPFFSFSLFSIKIYYRNFLLFHIITSRIW
nr:MAG TPA: hypothetical protein [Caudoviricetes sp.]